MMFTHLQDLIFLTPPNIEKKKNKENEDIYIFMLCIFTYCNMMFRSKSTGSFISGIIQLVRTFQHNDHLLHHIQIYFYINLQPSLKDILVQHSKMLCNATLKKITLWWTGWNICLYTKEDFNCEFIYIYKSLSYTDK